MSLREQRHETSSPRRTWIWVLVLAGLLGGLAWISYPVLKEHNGMLSEFSGVKQSLASAIRQIDETKATISQWAGEQEALKEQLAKLENGVAARLKAASHQAEQTRATVMNWVRVELDRRDEAVASRISQLEAAHQNEVARVRAELDQIKQSVAGQQTRLTALEDNTSSDKELAHQKLVELNARLDQGQREVRDLAHRIETQRLDFEVAKNHSQQLAPGISLCVTKTDVACRRVSGWMWIMPDRKTIWLREQGAL